MGVLEMVGTGLFIFGGAKKRAATELDREESIREEDGMPPETTPGRERGTESSDLVASVIGWNIKTQ